MRVLLRLPNWLGDLVMSIGFLRSLGHLYPQAKIEVIINKELAELVPYFPHISRVHPFDRAAHRSLGRTYRYGRKLRKSGTYTHYFTLPSSFSAAWMGYATGAKVRVGFRAEGRQFLLTHAYALPKGLHRSEEYVYLLRRYFGSAVPDLDLSLRLARPKNALLPQAALRIGLNFNSAQTSKTLPKTLALSYIDRLVEQYPAAHFFLLGSPKQRSYNAAFLEARPLLRKRLHNYAGKTTLLQLGQLLTELNMLISTDSGSAHLANSLRCPLLVLMGPGDEKNTGPYIRQHLIELRAPGIPCAPCVKTYCKWGEPRCLLAISATEVIRAADQLLKTTSKNK